MIGTNYANVYSVLWTWRQNFPHLIYGPCLFVLDFFSGEIENGEISMTGINAAATAAGFCFNIVSYPKPPHPKSDWQLDVPFLCKTGQAEAGGS